MRIKSYQSGWFDKELKCAIWKRNLLKEKKPLTEYKILRTKISSLIKKKKRTYFNETMKK